MQGQKHQRQWEYVAVQMESKLSIFPGVVSFPVIMFQLIIQFDVKSFFPLCKCLFMQFFF